jgi:hypothetical protein
MGSSRVLRRPIETTRLYVHLSPAHAERAVKRPLLEKAVEAYSGFTPAKRPLLKIGDVNTMWFVKPKGRDSEES